MRAALCGSASGQQACPPAVETGCLRLVQCIAPIFKIDSADLHQNGISAMTQEDEVRSLPLACRHHSTCKGDILRYMYP